MADIIGSIPIDTIVKVVPSALGTGTGVSFFNGLFLTRHDLLPPKTLRVFTSAKKVDDFFASSLTRVELRKFISLDTRGRKNCRRRCIFTVAV